MESCRGAEFGTLRPAGHRRELGLGGRWAGWGSEAEAQRANQGQGLRPMGQGYEPGDFLAWIPVGMSLVCSRSWSEVAAFSSFTS